jgi:glutamate dehydrogenase
MQWLFESMPPYFFITMRNELESLSNLIFGLPTLLRQHKFILTDEPTKLIVARIDARGSVYDTLRSLKGREISYAEFTHSNKPIPGTEQFLEILRFDFERKGNEEVASDGEAAVPSQVYKKVLEVLKRAYPDFDRRAFPADLRLLWVNNKDYVLFSTPERVARTIRLYQQGRRHDGLFLDIERVDPTAERSEIRLLFSIANPPGRGFLTQVMEVFARLGLGARRSYYLNINNGLHWNFLGIFYVNPYDEQVMDQDSEVFHRLKRELYNTQILAADNAAYTIDASKGVMNGEEASLANALLAFARTTLAHGQPDRFDLEAVKSALFSDPAMIVNLIALFKARFDPDITNPCSSGAMPSTSSASTSWTSWPRQKS